jgi:hypothetical protein
METHLCFLKIGGRFPHRILQLGSPTDKFGRAHCPYQGTKYALFAHSPTLSFYPVSRLPSQAHDFCTILSGSRPHPYCCLLRGLTCLKYLPYCAGNPTATSSYPTAHAWKSSTRLLYHSLWFLLTHSFCCPLRGLSCQKPLTCRPGFHHCYFSFLSHSTCMEPTHTTSVLHSPVPAHTLLMFPLRGLTCLKPLPNCAGFPQCYFSSLSHSTCIEPAYTISVPYSPVPAHTPLLLPLRGLSCLKALSYSAHFPTATAFPYPTSTCLEHMHTTSVPYSPVSDHTSLLFSSFISRPAQIQHFSRPPCLSWSCLLLVRSVVRANEWELASCSCIPIGSFGATGEPTGNDCLAFTFLLFPI